MSTDQIYSHFHPDEHRFVDKAAEWVARAEQHEAKLTDFLDPRQAFILTTLVNRSMDVQLLLNGGHPSAERRRAWVAPDYRVLESEDPGITLLSITSPDEKLEDLDHGDYMGAILSLGIKREKVGDIHVRPDGCHILVASEIADYFRLNLSQVHRVHVMTEVLPLERLQFTEVKLEELQLSVASLRLDGIVSDVYRLSRAKVLVPIKAGRCKVNWKQEEDPSKPLREGDVVSLQGAGRFKVLEIEGVTKKGRTRVKIGKYS
ncbi:RNA-binding S4 domain-containing protein [Paenibacillus mucilaginosus 3016]|uniref:RNA-binding S4 domain-containing protein n=2 Tax=Paenibacillus mucilaginosus TaxID=61624 RepID=H6NG63_9BACL|nr:YlmH/Sll1252 family protein [Paenibacillus mucilaginosus]AFC32190.1 RNA-binding S4 domain-containing protein [Paenibacillus mucilaginosus 3016]AFH64491.1 RNA-binding protein S4 [Paenibacillus mucilaginosus K02]WFA20689.1 RNA-binding protein [Paenibacillus mucilaginosus]